MRHRIGVGRLADHFRQRSSRGNRGWIRQGTFFADGRGSTAGHEFVGIEIERKYTLFTANRLAKRQLGNVRVGCGDARLMFGRLPESSVQAVHIFFPDPWWKNRHRKRRLFTAEFVEACVRILKPGGNFNVVSDVAEYFAVITQLLGQHQRLQPLPPPSSYQPRHDLDFLTNFERKYRQEGRPIYRGFHVKANSYQAHGGI